MDDALRTLQVVLVAVGFLALVASAASILVEVRRGRASSAARRARMRWRTMLIGFAGMLALGGSTVISLALSR
jgi:hypothetical protein